MSKYFKASDPSKLIGSLLWLGGKQPQVKLTLGLFLILKNGRTRKANIEL